MTDDEIFMLVCFLIMCLIIGASWAIELILQ
jgi:hypothetical protein